MNDGYIKVYRSLVDSWLWADRPYSYGQAFEYILFSACFKPCKLLIDKKVVEVDRGEFYTSIRKLSEQFGWSRGKTKRFLELLKSDTMIDYQTSHNNTLVKVLNYCKYQDEMFSKKPPTEPPDSHSKATAEPLNDTKEESKESRECKKGVSKDTHKDIGELYNSICVSLPQVKQWSEPRERAVNNSTCKDWAALFQKVEASDFLTGRKGDFKASFDWIVKPSNLLKILEGNYDNRTDGRKAEPSAYENMINQLSDYVNGN